MQSNTAALLPLKLLTVQKYNMQHSQCSYQRLQFPLVNQTKLTDEVVKVLVASIDMGLGTHADDAVEMVDVDMHEDPEEASEDLCANLLEVLGERNT